MYTAVLSSKPIYTALSYVWRDPSDRRDILLDGRMVSIGANLAAGLLAIRYTEAQGIAVIWADALCINQSDDAEKLSQVQLMAQIFAGAADVCGWLGESTDDSDYAIEMIATMVWEIEKREEVQTGSQNVDEAAEGTFITSKHSDTTIPRPSDSVPRQRDDTLFGLDLAQLLLNLAEPTEGDSGPENDEISVPNRFWRSIHALFARPFWKRLRINQEVILAPCLILLRGKEAIPWHQVAIVGLYFWEAVKTSHTSFNYRSSVFSDFARVFEITEWQAAVAEPPFKPPIFSMIQNTFTLVASEPRDYVYGIVGTTECPNLYILSFRSGIVDFTQYQQLLSQALSSKEMLDLYLWIDIMTGQNSVFMTGGGFSGVGARLLEGGDKICMVPGMKTPVLLRPYRQHFQLVGTCFVNGLMDGEAVREDMDTRLSSLKDVIIQ
ncbi:heterokaryon incompatibility protein-domain-containing protein [Podospora didyma]|uniref:Heterokaryon incompatibility protein-domain-containing protein n=1 Tax=Podospora didyma TaxID=330526 RepID=A0AAE0TZJ9_9PEZI|nr:heterokaryon incompatibility protein-domain-containing protein [Podospora didyma]